MDDVKEYVCEECHARYAEKQWAEKCAKWCREHGSHNPEISRHAKKKK